MHETLVNNGNLYHINWCRISSINSSDGFGHHRDLVMWSWIAVVTQKNRCVCVCVRAFFWHILFSCNGINMKISMNMELENEPLEKEVPIQHHHVQVV